jgi:hypothetical protein
MISAIGIVGTLKPSSVQCPLTRMTSSGITPNEPNEIMTEIEIVILPIGYY